MGVELGVGWSGWLASGTLGCFPSYGWLGLFTEKVGNIPSQVTARAARVLAPCWSSHDGAIRRQGAGTPCPQVARPEVWLFPFCSMAGEYF